jgi:hypothetical protein
MPRRAELPRRRWWRPCLSRGQEIQGAAARGLQQAQVAKTAYIERGSPWENGYIESFNPRLRDAGHAGATANLKLTFHLDHSVGGPVSLPRRAARS